jgi:hypothetical protein
LLFNNDKATTSTNKKKTKRQISKNEKNKIKLRIITRSHFPSCERKGRLSSSVDNGGVLIRKNLFLCCLVITAKSILIDEESSSEYSIQTK